MAEKVFDLHELTFRLDTTNQWAEIVVADNAGQVTRARMPAAHVIGLLQASMLEFAAVLEARLLGSPTTETPRPHPLNATHSPPQLVVSYEASVADGGARLLDLTTSHGDGIRIALHPQIAAELGRTLASPAES